MTHYSIERTDDDLRRRIGNLEVQHDEDRQRIALLERFAIDAAMESGRNIDRITLLEATLTDLVVGLSQRIDAIHAVVDRTLQQLDGWLGDDDRRKDET